LTAVEIAPISSELIEGYRRAVDTVARERRYLTLLEAFPIERTREFVLRLVASGDPIYVALANGAVVGWCDIQRHPFPTHAHRGTLGMGVVPNYRLRGVGLCLIRQTLEAGFAKGLVRIELSVRADNLHAMGLYQKVGFVVEGVLRDAVFVDGEYHDAIAMALIDKTRLPQ
jgi:RimJ/RimL family protein N-acetyltransferase